MIQFKTPLGVLKLPSNFSEITVRDFDFIHSNNDKPVEVLQLLTGMEADKLMRLDLNPLVIHLEFLNVDLLEAFESSTTIMIEGKLYELPTDIKRETWGQKLMASQALRNGELVKMLTIYLQPTFHGGKFDEERLLEIEPILESLSVEAVYSCVIHIANGLKEIADKEKVLNNTPTPEQVQAGIGQFNVLGDMNVVDMVAQGKPWRYDEVLALDYNTIFAKLYHIKINANFEKRYFEIINKKK